MDGGWLSFLRSVCSIIVGVFVIWLPLLCTPFLFSNKSQILKQNLLCSVLHAPMHTDARAHMYMYTHACNDTITRER